MRRWLPMIATWTLVLALGLAAVAKAVDPRAFQLQLLASIAVPTWVAALIACALPPLEVVVIVHVLRPAWRRVGATQALVLVAAFSGWQLASVVSGQEACGCFGSWLRYPPAVGLAIDGVLAVAAVVVLTAEAGWSRTWRWAVGMVPIVVLVTLGAGMLMR